MDDLSESPTLKKPGGKPWSLAEGAPLGGYRVVKPLGRGGMGEVYLVENVLTRKLYALKLLPAELARDPGFRGRFAREAAVLQELRHDGIVMVHHAAEEDGRFFLTMDYVEGGSLDDRLKAEGEARRPEVVGARPPASASERGSLRPVPLQEAETARIALELCDALAYAHGKGVIHRDIKPANVLLDKDGRAKLSDFGLARVVGDDFLKSMTERSVSLSMQRTGGRPGRGARPCAPTQSDNAVVGTYEYMSPEQKAGALADERSDIFSLGLMLYRMLTGERAEGRFDLPSEVGCNSSWDGVIEKTLAAKPERRYADVAGLADDLKQVAVEVVTAASRWREEERRGAAEERQRREKEAAERRRREEERRRREVAGGGAEEPFAEWFAALARSGLPEERKALCRRWVAVCKELAAEAPPLRLELGGGKKDIGLLLKCGPTSVISCSATHGYFQVGLQDEDVSRDEYVRLRGDLARRLRVPAENVPSDDRHWFPKIADHAQAHDPELDELAVWIGLVMWTVRQEEPSERAPARESEASAPGRGCLIVAAATVAGIVLYTVLGAVLGSGKGSKRRQVRRSGGDTLRAKPVKVARPSRSPGDGQPKVNTRKVSPPSSKAEEARRHPVVLSGHTGNVDSVAFSPDGRHLATGSVDKTARLWSVPDGRHVATLSGHSDPLFSVAFSPDGRHLATGSGDKTARLWSVPAGRHVATLVGHSSLVSSVIFSPDGRNLATGSEDSTARLWSVPDGKLVAVLSGHSDMVSSVAFSPDGRHLATASLDKTARLWAMPNGRQVATLSGHSAYVSSLAFSPDGQYLATGPDVWGGEDNTARLWSVPGGKLVATLSGHSETGCSVAFSPDGRHLATGSRDKTARLWSVPEGRHVVTLSGHTSWVNSVAFSPDGRHLATGSDDKTARLWSVPDGALVATLSGHSRAVFSVAFSPDGRHLATGSSDKTARLWPFPRALRPEGAARRAAQERRVEEARLRAEAEAKLKARKAEEARRAREAARLRAEAEAEEALRKQAAYDAAMARARSLVREEKWKETAAAYEEALRQKPGHREATRLLAEARREGNPATLTLDLGGGVTMELVYIKPGRFTMGSNSGSSNERPAHQVGISSGFFMGKHEVTQAQYKRIMRKNPSRFKDGSNPVEQLSWKQATGFCRKLSQRSGRKVRLPTEAEWEYACRAGSTTRFCFGDSENGLGEYAWHSSNSGRKPHSVGGKRANAWGLHDMHGNVFEWCADWYDKAYYAKSPGRDPSGPTSGSFRVLRGGSWLQYGSYCRSASRLRDSPRYRFGLCGFRVAVSAPGQ